MGGTETLCLYIVPVLYGSAAYPEEYVASTFGQDLLFSMAVALVINGALRVRRLVGGRVLTNFLLGRYYRPLREGRIFMFLDLADSTRLSEQMGDVKVQSMIRDFFFDIARPIVQCGGETHRYIGDEIVVTWPLGDPDDNFRCLDCVMGIEDVMSQRSEWYRNRYGVVPKFRIGLHGGPVVASEVGDNKREIVYFGDTVNTAARIQSLCKTLGKPTLISQDLLQHINTKGRCQCHSIGDHQLPGKNEPVGVCEISPAH